MVAMTVRFDDDRLPWLEPYRDWRPTKRHRRRVVKIVIGLAAVAAAIAAGYFVGRDVGFPSVTSVVVALAPVGPARGVEREPAARFGTAAIDAPAEADAVDQQPLDRRLSSRPGPPGQVVQLGAFQKAATANRAYRATVARYPQLRSMPHVVFPVVTSERRRTLYVLRLGTTSRQQSAIVCRGLRARGEQCLVIG